MRGAPWMDETCVLLEKLPATSQARQRNYQGTPKGAFLIRVSPTCRQLAWVNKLSFVSLLIVICFYVSWGKRNKFKKIKQMGLH